MYEEKYFLKNKQHIFDEFEFKNGSIIENANVDYGVVGTPKYDEEGNIINAVLFCHNFHGNYSKIADMEYLSDESFAFRDEYFFISITSLGFHGSCSPSSSGLNNDFPNYEIEDLVNFQRQLLKEKFPNIKKLKGIIGYSLGGFIALGWSILYPDDIDFVVHLDSSFKAHGYVYIFANLVNRAIDQSSEYLSNTYDESISKMLIFISQLHYLMSFSSYYLNELSNEEIDVSIDSFAEDILFLDIYDIKCCNDFLISFDLESQLDKIKCKLLVVSSNSTNYFNLKHDSLPLHEAVEDSQMLSFDLTEDSKDSDKLRNIESEIKKFMDSA